MKVTTRILHKIVHNEASKLRSPDPHEAQSLTNISLLFAVINDPPEIYGWRVYLLACSACFGAMSFGWDSSVIGGVITLQTFVDDYGLGDPKSTASANLAANIVSTLQAGCFVGSLAASPLTDRFGRKWCLIANSFIILAGVIMQAAASGHLAPMYIGRFIAGLGVGSASAINPLYVSENAPRAIRGLLTVSDDIHPPTCPACF